MALISISGAFTAPKRRPKAYRAVDAPYMVGGNRGYYIAALPRPYPINAPQRKVKNVAAECNIKKGIGKRELMNAMVDCVGPRMRKGG